MIILTLTNPSGVGLSIYGLSTFGKPPTTSETTGNQTGLYLIAALVVIAIAIVIAAGTGVLIRRARGY